MSSFLPPVTCQSLPFCKINLYENTYINRGDQWYDLVPGSKGIGPLADALLGLRKHLQSGERVYLRSLELRNLQLDVHSIRRLANSIGGSSTGGGSSSSCGPALQLSDLALHNNGLRPTDVAALAKLCTNMPSLASLRITSSDIGDEGARELDAMLQARRTRRLPLRHSL